MISISEALVKRWGGIKLNEPATAAEAILAAGLEWEVEKHPLFLADGRPVNRVALVRSDNRTILGTATPRYSTIQNLEAFEFFDEIVGRGEAAYHAAGAFRDGERVYILAKLPGTIRTIMDDVSEKFLLLTTGHDGVNSLQALFLPVRVFCTNVLPRLLSRVAVTIRHTVGNVKHKLTEARRLLGIADNQFTKMEDVSKSLASRQMTTAELGAYVSALVPDPEIPTERSLGSVKRRRETIHRLFETGRGNDYAGVRGTAWAALNAAVEFADYDLPVRGRSDSERTSRRAESALFGRGSNFKTRALNLLVPLVGIQN